MNKKFILLIFAIAFVVIGVCTVSAAGNKVVINRDTVSYKTYDNLITYQNNKPYVCFDTILKDLGYEMYYLDGNILNYKIDNWCILSIKEGSSIVSTSFNENGKVVNINYNNFNPYAAQTVKSASEIENYPEYAVKVINSHYYVPAESVMQAMTYTISSWDNSTSTLTINEYRSFFGQNPTADITPGQVTIYRNNDYYTTLNNEIEYDSNSGIYYVCLNNILDTLGYEAYGFTGNVLNCKIDNNYILSLRAGSSIISLAVNENGSTTNGYKSLSPEYNSTMYDLSDLTENSKYAVKFKDGCFLVPVLTLDRIIQYSHIEWNKEKLVLTIYEDRNSYGKTQLPEEKEYYVTAVPATTVFMKDGKRLYLKAYNINGTNYIGADDLVNHLQTSENSPSNLAVKSETAEYNWYVMGVKADPSKLADDDRFEIGSDGIAKINVSGYTINGVHFYFNLKDLSALFGITYTYDSSNNTVTIYG